MPDNQVSDEPELPLSERSDADVPGHWLLARLGKRVLRPGGVELTTRLLDQAALTGADVIELAPGLGRTARDILSRRPASYTGVDSDARAVDAVRRVVGPDARLVVAEASETDLPAACADVVIGEAMLTMQGDKAKRSIIAEAARLLRPGGRYAIHELGLTPDGLPDETKTEIRRALARSIKVNARPQTIAEWTVLLEDAGLVVEHVDTARMALLQPKRILSDEGLRGTARFVRNLLTHPDARSRVLAMRRTFREHRTALIAVAIVARVPSSNEGSP